MGCSADSARRRARSTRPTPTVGAKHCDDLSRNLARPLDEITPAESEVTFAACLGGVVSIHIAPYSLQLSMSEPSVEFFHQRPRQQRSRVDDIEPLATTSPDALHLALAHRKSVDPVIAKVPDLERGLRSLSNVGKEFIDEAAVAKARAIRCSCSETVRRRRTRLDRPGEEIDDVAGKQAPVNDIENCRLDPGPRRAGTPVDPFFAEVGQVMNEAAFG
jgi:hypothetical protein